MSAPTRIISNHKIIETTYYNNSVEKPYKHFSLEPINARTWWMELWNIQVCIGTVCCRRFIVMRSIRILNGLELQTESTMLSRHLKLVSTNLISENSCYTSRCMDAKGWPEVWWNLPCNSEDWYNRWLSVLCSFLRRFSRYLHKAQVWHSMHSIPSTDDKQSALEPEIGRENVLTISHKLFSI